MFFPEADTIAFAEGGAESMRLNSSGNVGIGTSSPTAKLHVTSANGQIVAQATSTNPSLLLRSATNNRNWEVGSFATNAGEFFVYDGVATAIRLQIDTSGRMVVSSQPAFFAGIGSTSDATIALNSFMPFNQTVLNTGSNFNTSTNRFTAPVSGRYFFSWQIFYTDSAGANYTQQTGLNVNGSYISFTSGDAFVTQVNASLSGPCCFGASAVVNLSANDVVGIMVRSGNVRVYQGHCNFSGYLLG
jgi:hypothetical protein